MTDLSRPRSPRLRVGPVRASVPLVALLALPILSAPTGAQIHAQEIPISLDEARRQAAEAHPGVQAALSRAEGAAHHRDASRAYRFPTVGAELDALRTNDPVAAFGSRLRQGRFTEADFAPDRLNQPDALGDWSVGLGLNWSPLDATAAAGARAAEALALAAGQGAQWAIRAAAFGAEGRYLEAVGAEARLEAAEAAVEAAAENLRVTERRRDEGMVTEADVLQARAAVEDAGAREIQARQRISDTRARLGLALGWEPGRIPVPTDRVLDSDADTTAAASFPPLSDRPDLQASASRLDASESRVREARNARLPKVEGFARVGTHARAPFSSPETNWTVGLHIRLPVYTGGGIGHRVQAVDAEREALRREHEQRLREAQVEVDEARRALEFAGEALAAAAASAEASAEAARFMRRRFQEDLVTAADLVAVEARAAEAAARRVDAAVGHALAGARLRFLTDLNANHGALP